MLPEVLFPEEVVLLLSFLLLKCVEENVEEELKEASSDVVLISSVLIEI